MFLCVWYHYIIQDSTTAMEAMTQFQMKLCPTDGSEAQPHT